MLTEFITVIRRSIMKDFIKLIIMLLLVSLFLSIGCRSMQSEGRNEANRVDQSDWRPTGTGFYVPANNP